MTSELDSRVAGLSEQLQHFVGAPDAEQTAVYGAMHTQLCSSRGDPSVVKQLVEQGSLQSVLQQTVARLTAEDDDVDTWPEFSYVAQLIGLLCQVPEADAVLSQQQSQQHLMQLIQLVPDNRVSDRLGVRDGAGTVLASVAGSAAGASALLSGSCLQVLQQHQEDLVQWDWGDILARLADTKKGRCLLAQQLELLRCLMQSTQLVAYQNGPWIVARVVMSEPETVAALVADYSCFCGALQLVSANPDGGDAGRALLQREHLAVIVAAAQVQPGDKAETQDDMESVSRHALLTLANIAWKLDGGAELLQHHMAGVLAVLLQRSQPQYSNLRWMIAAGLARHSAGAQMLLQHRQLISEAVEQCQVVDYCDSMLTELTKHPAAVQELLLHHCLQQLCSKYKALVDSGSYLAWPKTTQPRYSQSGGPAFMVELAALLSQEPAAQKFIQEGSATAGLSVGVLLSQLQSHKDTPHVWIPRGWKNTRFWPAMYKCHFPASWALTVLQGLVQTRDGVAAVTAESNVQQLLELVRAHDDCLGDFSMSDPSGPPVVQLLIALVKKQQGRQALQSIKKQLAAEIERRLHEPMTTHLREVLAAIDGVPFTSRSYGGVQHSQVDTEAAPTDAVTPHTPATIAAVAAAGLSREALALVKHEVGAMPNEQQLQYWRLADQPFDAAELQQLAARYLMHRKVTRGYYESRSGRQREVVKSGSPAVTKYETLAPVLLQLWQQVQDDPAHAAAAGPAASRNRPTPTAASSSVTADLTASPATKTLLRALRTLQLWETQQTTQPQMPQALQCLVPPQPSSTVNNSAAAATDAIISVQEVIDLTGDDDIDDNSSEQMQQFLAGQVEFVLVKDLTSSNTGGTTGPKRIKVEPVHDME